MPHTTPTFFFLLFNDLMLDNQQSQAYAGAGVGIQSPHFQNQKLVQYFTKAYNVVYLSAVAVFLRGIKVCVFIL